MVINALPWLLLSVAIAALGYTQLDRGGNLVNCRAAGLAPLPPSIKVETINVRRAPQ